MTIPALLKTDLECPRSAAELYTWLRGIHCKFGATAEGKTALRERSEPYVKVLLEEIWPLASYAWLFFRERNDLQFQPVIGNQHYDALLLDQFDTELSRFEITQALHGEAGYQDRLRREHLDRFSHAPMTGSSLKREAGSRVLPEQWNEYDNHANSMDETFKLIRAAITAKASKTYSTDTALIVEFQGGHFHLTSDQENLDSLARTTFCELASRFSELALIDDTARFGFRYPLRGSRAA